MKRPQARPTVQVENERAIVTEWRFAPGAETGWHRHEYDYVVVPQTNGELLLERQDGNAFSQLVAGSAYFRSAGVEHNVVNNSSHEVVFIEMEIKR
jgi:beta-alanine degradation protein BauB